MKKPLPFTHPLFLLALLILAGACSSPMELVETGNYDQAIQFTKRKLAGKKNKNPKFVAALEEAFNRANARDLAEADRLKRNQKAEDWPAISKRYSDIRARQERIAPLLPLIDKHGYQAEFKFVKIEELEREAQSNSAEYFYRSANDKLHQAKQGDRLAARRAMEDLQKIDQYYLDYKNKEVLKQEAQQLGTTYILIELENRAPVVMPAEMEKELLRIDAGDLDTKWREYHTRKESGVDYDYRVEVSLMDMIVGPSQIKEREFIETAEIEDGLKYVLDERGNVKKDTAGNDIKEPNIVEVRANVLEVYQSKAASIVGQIEIFEMDTDRSLDRKEVIGETIFENYASTFRGDKRALSKKQLQYIGNQPVEFPDDFLLLMDAARQMRPTLYRLIRNSRQIL